MTDRKNETGFILARDDHRQRELRYQKLLDATTDYTYTVQYGQGEPVETLHSPRSYAITGYTPEEYEKAPSLWYEMIHEKDRTRVLAELNKLLTGAAIPPFEHRIIHKDGSVRWVRNTTVPCFAEGGSLLGYDALVTDITEKKIAGEKIAKANRAYKTLSLCNQALVRSKTEQGLLENICHILVAHGGYALAWVGYARQDEEKSVRVAAKDGNGLQFLRALKISWAATEEDGQRPAGEAIRSGHIVINNNTGTSPYGKKWKEAALHHGYLSSIALPLFSEGNVFGTLNIYAEEIEAFTVDEVQLLSELSLDLSYGIMALRTKKKHEKSAKALAASETRLQCIFDTVQTGILLIDQETQKILDVNLAAAGLIGIPPKKIIGRSCHEFCPAEKERYPILDMGQQIDNSERILLNANGEEIPILKSEVQLELNGRKCLLASFLDISKRVRDEKERIALQGQLRQAQKMEAIGTLAGGIAHDFNNILQAILGYGGMLLHTLPKESEPYEFALAITGAAKSAAELVRQILTFSRQTEVERIPLKLQYLTKEVLKLLRRTLPSTISLQENIDLSCTPILADSSHIHQIIMNLGTNAYHALPDQGGIIAVKLDEVEVDGELIAELPELSPGKHVRLTFSDNGCGMDRVTRQRLFEPYFTTKEKEEGTGLGLAIVHGIITGYNGAIRVESSLGEGTSFTLFFPALEEYAPLEERKMDLVLPKMRGRVLFVDDVKFNVELGKHILKRVGCEVFAFTDSREALDHFCADPEKFDLVITDQTMPFITGFELAKKMLAIRPNLPIIMVTGHSEIVNEEMAKAAGIRKFLMKPMDIGTIAKAMEEFLRPVAASSGLENEGKKAPQIFKIRIEAEA
ncbi:MAG: PAS domain S-box protein [Desulfobulbaceae bacterium]|nr:PAS domain S-box protein [Desulfobulbaceae bacterium]HIJ89509.1 PAS domain S-box protein [Deltaproteobacteria bacterium]